MMGMNSDKNYKWDKKKYESMNIKVEVHLKAVIIILWSKNYTIISNNHNHNNSNNDN